MNRRALSLALACALSLSLLSACGGRDNSSLSAPVPGGSGGSASDSSVPDASRPDASVPDASTPDASRPDGSSPIPLLEEFVPVASLSLNKNDFTLKSAGASYRLKYACEPDTDAIPEFSSSDESVATVARDGTVTAVAPGTAIITVDYDGLTAQCVVRCRWEEKADSSSGSSSSGSSSSGSSSSGSSGSAPAPSAKVDLAAFHDSISSKLFSSMTLADQEVQDAFYPGLSEIGTEQCLVYANLMSLNMGELVLVQVKDSRDVDAVKAILQARVDNMVNGGAWYPEPTRVWSECAQVVSNGCYIMMVVNDDYQSIVDDFNALF